MIKAVVDTNVLVSGIISPKSSPAKIINYWRERKFVLVTSPKILQETKRVLNYPKIAKKYHLNKEKINELIREFSLFSEVCKPTKKISVIQQDPEDNKFLEAGISASADFIVSGDSHLLNLREYQGIKILTAKEFIAKLEML